MRFSCITAIIALCIGFSSAHPRTTLAQPYQKAWTGPIQRGSGSHQKQYGCAPGTACQQPCYPPCYPPCEPDQPKDARPDQPRAAAPGIAPGVFVSPPQSGVVEGPSRGFEIGNISLTLPELKLGLPRLRWEGVKHLSRDARMMTDRAAAPYVGNPYYASAMAQSQSRAASRGAQPNEEDGSKKSAKKKDRGAKKQAEKGDTAKGACQADLELRLQRLEGCFEMQVQTLQSCVEELRALRSAESAYQKSSTHLPQPQPRPGNGAEARSDVPARSLRSFPPTGQVVSGEEAAQANYEVHVPENAVPQPVLLRRLPAAIP